MPQPPQFGGRARSSARSIVVRRSPVATFAIIAAGAHLVRIGGWLGHARWVTLRFVITTETCPMCGALVPTAFGYVPWCECGWNLSPFKPLRPPTRADRVLARVGSATGARLYERVRRDGGARRRLDLPVIVAWALAVAIHLITLAFLILGVVLLVGSRLHLVALILGVLFLLLAWLMRPRFPAWPDDEHLVTHENMPELLGLVSRVSTALGARPVDRVYVTPEYNASFGRYGWRRQGGLRIGLPLFAALEGQERVALLGHEVAHGVNGDPLRGLVIGTASAAIWQLYTVIRPARLVPRGRGLIPILSVPFVLIQAGIAELIWLVMFVLIQASAQSRQQAEYRADIMASKVAGRSAELSMTERLHLGASVARMTWVRGSLDPVGVIVDKVRQTPKREVERIRRIELLKGSRLDYSHPPTVYRVGVIQALPPTGPLVLLDSTTSARIDAELEPVRGPIGKQIVASHEVRIGG